MDRLHMSVTGRDIETKLFKKSDNRTMFRPENMENVVFHGNSIEIFYRKSHGVSMENLIRYRPNGIPWDMKPILQGRRK